MVALSDIQELKNLSLISNNRFEITATNYDGEVEDAFDTLTSKVVETNNGVSLFVPIPQGLNEMALNTFTSTCNYLKSIKIKHLNNFNQEVFTLLHNISSFDGWEIVSDSNGTDILTIKLNFSSVPVVPVSQSEEGLSEWLKKQREA